MNTSTKQNTLFTLPKRNVAALAVCVLAFLAFQSTNPARMVAGFIILATISLIAYIVFCLIRLVFKKIAAHQPKANMQTQPVTKTKTIALAQPIASANTRIAAIKRMPGEEMMEIPAYARKAMNRHFPMTVSDLKKAHFTIKSQKAFIF
ncbi:hypothetical protein G6Z92_18645 [Vibrio aestuarianus subsp. cardii]|uniref:hypothetical protein n=1 Tax=Vibrio aestuarianus TaxID=28171 RepID=UPI0015C55030|nr:hypothetical protein [Vibrio aestuarianus]NGZ68936.1 hypothetical protein [Vibrio aestuarianus subsp. cardii]